MDESEHAEGYCEAKHHYEQEPDCGLTSLKQDPGYVEHAEIPSLFLWMYTGVDDREKVRMAFRAKP